MIRTKLENGVLEVELCREPMNEIGREMLAALEKVDLGGARAVVLFSSLKQGFCAGADLRELYHAGREMKPAERRKGVRDFLKRIHAFLNRLDEAPVPTVAAVHGAVFGGGLELALACDLIVADRSTRFAFPELRLGLVPGFGGIPRLKRDVPNSLVRDLLFTGRSINAEKALQAGLVGQVVAEGQAVRAARATAAQMAKFDPETAAAAKRFIKPFPKEELMREMELFLELFERPVVQEALRKFVEDKGPMPYLP
ncbi:MAG: enoyl-CoA hydratase/isomerase family protein [Planctomycetes bacterium]|nr:enoyl-CoA hydratase/isomerase family protein [Planctomycetota bacterium]